MIGGRIIKVNEVEGKPEELEIICRGSGTEKGDVCAIKIRKSTHWRAIQSGDSIWWHGRKAMWTIQENLGKKERRMKQGIDYNIEFVRQVY